MFTVALTGGIASGKSTVAAEFRSLGVPVIDTDRIARDVVLPGEAGLAALVAEFGPEITLPSGDLDRRAIRQQIFSDPAARQRVNTLLHPLIRERLAAELRSTSGPYAIVEIPLLAETGSADEFDRVLVVDVPEEIQLERVQTRDAAQQAEALAALQAQASRQERLAIADDIITNIGTLDALSIKIKQLHDHYLQLAKRFASRAGRPSE